MAVNKIYPDAKAALAGLLHDGMTIMSGGFGLCGIPAVLIDAIHNSGVEAASPQLLEQRRHRRRRASASC